MEYQTRRHWALVVIGLGFWGMTAGCEPATTTLDKSTTTEEPGGEVSHIPLSDCGIARPTAFVGEPAFVVIPDTGGCMVVAQDLVVFRPYSREAFDDLLVMHADWMTEVPPITGTDPNTEEPFSVPAPDTVLNVDGTTHTEYRQFLVRVNLDGARVWIDGLAGVTPEPDYPLAGEMDAAGYSLVETINALLAFHGGSVLDITPVVVAASLNVTQSDHDQIEGQIEGALSDKTNNCTCLNKSTAVPTYDALAPSPSADCDAHLKTSGTNLLMVTASTVYDTREGCFAGICNGPPGNFHAFVIPQDKINFSCGGQLDNCAPPGSFDTYIRGDHESGGKCEWGGFDLPTSLQYNRHGIYQWQTESEDELAYLYLWEGDECKGWWIFKFCNADDKIAIIPVRRGDTLGQPKEYKDTDYYNFGYGKPTITLSLLTRAPCGIDLEVCDGKDNNCDGIIDESDPQVGESCQPKNTAVCQLGTYHCRDGLLQCDDWVPTSKEYCDGKDNDCDGLLDESDPNVGKVCGSTLGVCKSSPQFVECSAGNLICGTLSVSTELCWNGLDDDCDGATDESPCGYSAGAVRDCGIDLGACQPGTETFDGAAWGPCEGLVGPGPEVCANNLDDDCDGQVDEIGCGCSEGETRPCGTSTGECEPGTQTCKGGYWATCKGGVAPFPVEVCDGKDNNCDGVVDETCQCIPGTEEVCGETNVGACKHGNRMCLPVGIWGPCLGEVKPKNEDNPKICDDVDNDCDGMVDEGCTCTGGTTQPCSNDVGVCISGVMTCKNGQWKGCDGITGTTEMPDGVDNDCDGNTDEGFECLPGAKEPCGTSTVGECKMGERMCQASGKWGVCVGNVEPKVETYPTGCDGKDNDCDGTVDEECVCPFGKTQTCSSDTGTCKAGTQTCVADGWTACTGIVPKAEVCDGLDNDCDGSVDEDFGCVCGTKKSCGSNVGICTVGTQTCLAFNGGATADWGPCTGTGPTSELCNGKDDNCNGSTDEGLLNACGGCGAVPVEVCDGKDNNCNGQVDEGVKNVCGTCGSVPTESCNAKDDDCDGFIDEGLSKCGLKINCLDFCLNDASGSGQLSLAAPPGSFSVPIIYFSSYEPGGEDDWAVWASAQYSNGVYSIPYQEAFAGASTKACGKVCAFAVSGTATAAAQYGSIKNGQTATWTAPAPNNPYASGSSFTIPMIYGHWTGTDDDFEWDGALSYPNFTLSTGGGNGDSEVGGGVAGFSLPAGYTVLSKTFNVYNGQTSTLSFDRNPSLGHVSLVTFTDYVTAGDDDYNYKGECSDSASKTTCTITSWNGSGSSRVAGIVYLIQGPF